MPPVKPSRLLRTGLIFGASGMMLVIVAGGLGLASLDGVWTPWLINLGYFIAIAGAALLVAGGLRYPARYRDVMGRRERELEMMARASEAESSPKANATVP